MRAQHLAQRHRRAVPHLCTGSKAVTHTTVAFIPPYPTLPYPKLHPTRTASAHQTVSLQEHNTQGPAPCQPLRLADSGASHLPLDMQHVQQQLAAQSLEGPAPVGRRAPVLLILVRCRFCVLRRRTTLCRARPYYPNFFDEWIMPDEDGSELYLTLFSLTKSWQTCHFKYQEETSVTGFSCAPLFKFEHYQFMPPVMPPKQLSLSHTLSAQGRGERAHRGVRLNALGCTHGIGRRLLRLFAFELALERVALTRAQPCDC